MPNIILFVDTSGSIANFKQNYTQAVLNIIEKLKQINSDIFLTLVLFNENAQTLCLHQPIRTCDFLKEIVPNGNTALYDCVSVTLNKMKKYYDKTFIEPPIVIILTDGDDSCSKLTNERLLALEINMLKAYGWKFVYLGIEEKAVILGRQMGCNVCVLYDTSVKSLESIGQIIYEIVENKVRIDIDIDLRTLTNAFEKMNFNF